jgi:hypothetical protein
VSLSGGLPVRPAGPNKHPRWGDKTHREDPSARAGRRPAGWTDSEACFYVDGLQTACEAYRWVRNEGQDAPPAHVLLNLAIGGNWAGRYGIADDGFPTSFDIDHVRVYRGG